MKNMPHDLDLWLTQILLIHRKDTSVPECSYSVFGHINSLAVIQTVY